MIAKFRSDLLKEGSYSECDRDPFIARLGESEISKFGGICLLKSVILLFRESRVRSSNQTSG